MDDYIGRLKQDLRFNEGLTACINCGTCTAACPAAAVTDYDPREVMDLVQSNDNNIIKQLLESDTIWRCGECLSCKTRCPRGNVPAYIIQSLRSLSIDSGLFIKSEQGRKQFALKRTIGDHILKYGYCVYFDEVNTQMYPEQGPVWDWLQKNRSEALARLGANYKASGPGSIRDIDKGSLDDLKRIFDITGATERFEKIEELSAQYAKENGIDTGEDMELYFKNIYEGR